MTIASTGPVAMSNISVELGLSATATKSLNDANVRSLLAKPSGTISLADARGKSNAPTVTNATIWASSYYTEMFVFEGWNSDPANGVIFGSASPSPIPIPGGGTIVAITSAAGSDTTISTKNYAGGSLTISINGASYTFPYSSSSGGFNYYTVYSYYMYDSSVYAVTV